MPGASAESEISGTIERIIFFNEENSYCIAELKQEGGSETVTVVGNLPGIQCGETVSLAGLWSRHPSHGRQFKVKSFESKLPASVYGIRKYLGSGLVKGVSKGLADRIVARFGEATLSVISDESARLQEVSGIGRQRARSIKQAWDEQAALRYLSLFLATYGITPAQIIKIYREYGFVAVDLIKENPYRLARDISGIGFKTCDRMAINMGIGNDGPQRIDAGILFVLQELQDEGHTAFPAAELVDKCAETLDTPRNFASEGLQRLFKSKTLARADLDSGAIFAQLPYHRANEDTLARSARRLQTERSGLPPIKIEPAIDWAQERAGFAFGDGQRLALHNALSNKFSILTGGPGTGKTTILRALTSILRAKRCRVVLAAPTGRAAKRLSEATGCHAQTIHRLLKIDPATGSFGIDASNPLKADFVVIDEASMLDTRLAASLVQAVASPAHLLLVGDVDQLPSVGAGNVLKDLIQTKLLAVARLDAVYRQKKQSSIVYYAHAINRGEPALPSIASSLSELDPGKDFQFLLAEDQATCAQLVLDVFSEYLPQKLGFDPVGEAQALAPMHRGIAGVSSLNQLLQERLNPAGPSFAYGSLTFRIDDKVLQTRNNYEKGVFNGDIGRIASVDPSNGTLVIDFDGERVDYDRADLLDLTLAYSVSIHKSQGSEYPVVVIPLLKAHYMMLQRNLIYTALTRGKRKAIFVGDPTAYAMATRNNKAQVRITLLREAALGQIKV